MTSAGTSGQSSAGAASGDDPDHRVDAVRYAVLRKLAPGLRHALMGELQAIQFAAELAARSLGADADLAEVRDTLGRIPHQCADAVKTGRSLIEWIRPEAGASAPVGDCVGQCLKLAGEDWFLRGIEATTDVSDANARVSKAALQELLVTALLMLTDLHNQPVDLQVTIRPAGDRVDVVVQAHAAERTASISLAPPHRRLACADLELLASAHGAACVCGNGTVSLQFQRLDPPDEGAP